MHEPAGTEIVMLELARMKAAGLKQRKEADADLNASLIVLAEELAGYSADVVRGACREWARTQVFWPSLAELRRECEDRAKAEAAAQRRLLLPRPDRFVPTHGEILERLTARYGWLQEWLEAGGGQMPCAVKRATDHGPIIAIRRKPTGPWEPVEAKRAAA